MIMLGAVTCLRGVGRGDGKPFRPSLAAVRVDDERLTGIPLELADCPDRRLSHAVASGE